MPTVQSKIIITVIFSAICYLIYYNFIGKQATLETTDAKKTALTESVVKDKLNQDVLKKFSDAGTGIYLYHSEKDQLYLKQPNPTFKSSSPSDNFTNTAYLYYNAGKGADCPGMLNNEDSGWKQNPNSSNAIPTYTLIKGSTAYFSCNNITNSDATEDVKKRLIAECRTPRYMNNPGAIVKFTSKTEDVVKNIEEQIKLQGHSNTIMAPHPNMCKSPDNLSDKSKNANEPSSTDNDLGSFLSQNREMIIALAFPLAGGKVADKLAKSGDIELSTKVGGVVKAMTFFYMAYTILPGFWNLPANSWEFQKNAATGLSLFDQEIQEHVLGYAIDKLEKAITENIAEKAAQKAAEKAAEKAGGAAGKAATKTATKSMMKVLSSAARYAMMAMKGLLRFTNQILSILGGGIATAIQIAGMIVDALDPCNINSSAMNLDQKTLDMYRESYDSMLYMSTKGMSYPTIFDPSPICEYDLDCNNTFDCLSDEEKKANEKNYTSSEEYCVFKGDTEKLKQYMDEYLENLTVNSSGECIGDITNDVLATYFDMYVGGGYDWSFIRDIKEEEVVLPKDKQTKVLELLLANQNVLVASYIDQNKYYVMAVFILVVVIMFVIN